MRSEKGRRRERESGIYVVGRTCTYIHSVCTCVYVHVHMYVCIYHVGRVMLMKDQERKVIIGEDLALLSEFCRSLFPPTPHPRPILLL